MSPLATKILTIISKAIEKDQLVLPTMPEMALQVRETANDPEANLKSLADTISGDAALTARIIKVANSPLYRGTNKIEDLNQSLMRLGMATTCSLAIGLAMEQMFQATSDIIDKRLRDSWKRSSEMAGVCALLCKHTTKLRPDLAFLSGISHQIGILPILSFAEEHPSLLRDGMTLDSVIEEIHPTIGLQILSEWDFPEEIQHVPRDHLDFKRRIAKADYADITTIAMLQCCAAKGLHYQELDYNEVTAFERLGLSPDIEHTQTEQLGEEMENAMSMLSMA